MGASRSQPQRVSQLAKVAGLPGAIARELIAGVTLAGVDGLLTATASSALGEFVPLRLGLLPASAPPLGALAGAVGVCGQLLDGAVPIPASPGHPGGGHGSGGEQGSDQGGNNKAFHSLLRGLLSGLLSVVNPVAHISNSILQISNGQANMQ